MEGDYKKALQDISLLKKKNKTLKADLELLQHLQNINSNKNAIKDEEYNKTNMSSKTEEDNKESSLIDPSLVKVFNSIDSEIHLEQAIGLAKKLTKWINSYMATFVSLDPSCILQT